MTNGDHAVEPETASVRSQSIEKDRSNRRSVLRTQGSDGGPLHAINTDNSEWMTDSGERGSSEARGQTSDREHEDRSMSMNGHGTARLGSVRKRLSMLKLGKKSSRERGLMKSVDEE